ncbi:MAG: type II toxin-antitoxin system CcdA family antitoxin [Alphaproteobacteria bacterium]
MSTAPHQRKPTNLALDRSLLPEARELKINLSRATDAGVRQKLLAQRRNCGKQIMPPPWRAILDG